MFAQKTPADTQLTRNRAVVERRQRRTLSAMLHVLLAKVTHDTPPTSSRKTRSVADLQGLPHRFLLGGGVENRVTMKAHNAKTRHSLLTPHELRNSAIGDIRQLLAKTSC